MMGGRYPSDFVLSSITQPVLAMEGSKDNLSNVQRIVDRVKNGRYRSSLGLSVISFFFVYTSI